MMIPNYTKYDRKRLNAFQSESMISMTNLKPHYFLFFSSSLFRFGAAVEAANIFVRTCTQRRPLTLPFYALERSIYR